MFQHYSKIVFEGVTVTNLFDAYRINPDYFGEQYYRPYQIKNGVSPEHVARRVYGTETLWWLVLLYANIRDPYLEWPLSSGEISRTAREWAISKYGPNGPKKYRFEMEKFRSEIWAENEKLKTINVMIPDAALQVIRDIEMKFVGE